MTVFGALGFTTPWLLLGMLALPVLWIVLRAVPPAPVRRMFPGVALLLGLTDDSQETDRTPWWLLMLRSLAVAAVIAALAGPVLNPRTDGAGASDLPLLVVMDATWASAPDWARRVDAAEARMAEAGRRGRPVALILTTAPEPAAFQPASAWIARLPGMTPAPWQAGPDQLAELILGLPQGAFDTYWVTDGLARDTRRDLLDALDARGTVTVVATGRPILGLAPVRLEDGALVLTLKRATPGPARQVTVAVHGTDPAGNPVVLDRADASFDPESNMAEARLTLPAELRARITRIEIEGQRSAGAVTLPDDTLRTREIALVGGSNDREGLQLLSPLHYLTKALEPQATLLTGPLTDSVPANPDAVILADVAVLAPAERAALTDWVESGGTLVRFAGPRLAASDISRADEDRLMPVRLRVGGRTVGGAMSWGAPKALSPFDADSPFAGLIVPKDVRITAQVLAQPDPTLADRVIAQLTDGTPLVTRKRLGQGQVILFHITANAEWSTLPLSGLFEHMLERLAISVSASDLEAETLAGTTWQPDQQLSGFGRLLDAGQLPGVDGARLVDAALGPDLPPGIYVGSDRSMARNVVQADTPLSAAVWPASVSVQSLDRPPEQRLAGVLLALALGLLAVDVLATLALGGRLVAAGLAVMAIGLAQPTPGLAQTDRTGIEDAQAIAIASEVRLAHVITGDARVDLVASQGLAGLSQTLFFRTSVEPGPPVGVDLERDELAFYPMLYWPVTADQPLPSDGAYRQLNTYLRSGGLILFDTRDADIARFGGGSAQGRMLRRLAEPLDIPPLEPIPQDHVLTRTFYLLQDFPGRHAGRDVWVEAAAPDAELAEGMPFRNLNDNVTPVVIGGNDWAAAWAMDDRGNALYPVGRGITGDRQREIAFRFGVNLVMHVLTGNYKSDQVHVPALLDRLGQ